MLVEYIKGNDQTFLDLWHVSKFLPTFLSSFFQSSITPKHISLDIFVLFIIIFISKGPSSK